MHKGAPAPSETHADPADRRVNRPFVGIGMKLTSTLAFTTMAALVKFIAAGGIGTSVPLGELVFFRSLFALLPVLLWLAYARPLSAAFATNNIRGHLKRGLIGSGGMFFSFAGLNYLPLPDATAISYTTPLLSVLLAWLLLGEVVRVYRWTAVVIGLVGVCIMLLPYLGAFGGGHQPDVWKGIVLAFTAAICAAFATIEVRKLTSTEHTGAIVVYFSLTTTTMSLVTYGFGLLQPASAWIWPGAGDFLVLAVVGFLGGIGQIFLTQCYRFAEPSIIAPFDYTSMIWALLFGWLVFAEVPKPLMLIGAAVVIASGIFVILREHALGRELRREREAAPTRGM